MTQTPARFLDGCGGRTAELMLFTFAVFHSVGLGIDGDSAVGTHQFDLCDAHAPQIVKRRGYRDSE